MKTFNNAKVTQVYSIQNLNELTECKRFNNNNLEQHCFYLNGNPHGEYKLFYPYGSLKEHYFYLNGMLHGECKWFYKDGTQQAHCFYLNDIKQPQLDYLITDRDEVTLTLLFGDNYENI